MSCKPKPDNHSSELPKIIRHSDAFPLLPFEASKAVSTEESSSSTTIHQFGLKCPGFRELVRSWKQELISCAVTNILLGFLYGYFYLREGRPWNLPISPNSLVSVLIVVIKTTLSIPLCEGTAQLKWLFCRKRKLQISEIAHLDDASRGEVLPMANLARHRDRG